MRRSKKKGRGNPYKGKSEPVPAKLVDQTALTPKGRSLGFAADRSRRFHPAPVPPIGESK